MSSLKRQRAIAVLSAIGFVGALTGAANAAVMTIGVQNIAGAGVTAAPQNVQNLSYVVGAGTSRVLVAYVSCIDSRPANIPVTGVTYGGAALTRLSSTTAATSVGGANGRSELWYLVNPTVGTATLSVSYTNSVSNRTLSAAVLTNVKQASTIDASTFSTTSASGSTISTAITTTTPGTLVFSGATSSGSTIDFSTSTATKRGTEVDLGGGNSNNSITASIATNIVSSASTFTNIWTTNVAAARLHQSLAAFAPIVSTLTTSPTDGSTISLTGIQPATTASSTDAVSLTNSGDTGSTISVSSFAITGTNAGLFSIPDFTTATLTAGGTSNILYDVGFLGAPTPGVYTAAVKFTTSDGDVSYNLSATVIPEPTTGIVFGLFGLAGLSARRRRSSSR